MVNNKNSMMTVHNRAMAADSGQPGRGPWSVTLHPYIHRKFMEYCPEVGILILGNLVYN